MLKNYFNIAWRNIVRRKTYAFINILSLSVGICICIVIFLITHYELSTDSFHPDRQRIYRVVEKVWDQNGHMEAAASVPADLALTVRGQLTGVETLAPFVLYGANIGVWDRDHKGIQYSNQIEGSNLPSTVLAGPEYFRIFHYEWLAGSPSTALTAANSVVLTKATALKLFGDVPPEQLVGRDMVFNDSLVERVTGIVKDWTAHTDHPFTEFISFSTRDNPFLQRRLFPDGVEEGFSPFLSRAFVKLAPGGSPSSVAGQLHAFAKLHPTKPGMRYDLTLQRLTDIHFDAHVADGFHKANLPTLYVLMGIGVFILLLAAINFISLSTALSTNRAKEIGIRKVIGGNRFGIAAQFLMETFLITFAALFVAVLAVRPVLSTFQVFLPVGMTGHLLDWDNAVFSLVLVVVTTFLAGLYPAKVLSGYLPVLSLKGPVAFKGRGNWYFRKGLIIFQFAISLVFIISTVIISRQINYMRTENLGFNTDAVISLDAGPQDRSPKVALFAERIRRLPGVKYVARQSFTPLSPFETAFDLQSKGGRDHLIHAGLQIADSNFIGLYAIHLLAGRNIIEGVNRDSIKEFVINESLRKAAGFKSAGDAVGQMLYIENHGFPIVGVVADYHENSYRQPIKPLVIFDLAGPEISFAVKLAAKGRDLGLVKNTLAQLERVWKEVYPGVPFSYSFLDDTIAAMYKNEQKTETLMNVAAVITIFISCMGLFGLSLFTAGQRAKEVSIRKVLGAEVMQIASLLTRDYVGLIGVSLLIASPVAWYVTHQWLEDFVYRAPVSIWTFLLCGGVVLVLGLLTVSVQTVRAAMANPVKNLRAE